MFDFGRVLFVDIDSLKYRPHFYWGGYLFLVLVRGETAQLMELFHLDTCILAAIVAIVFLAFRLLYPPPFKIKLVESPTNFRKDYFSVFMHIGILDGLCFAMVGLFVCRFWILKRLNLKETSCWRFWKRMIDWVLPRLRFFRLLHDWRSRPDTPRSLILSDHLV